MEPYLYIFTGGWLGLAAGLAPGPLLTLVITETLKHGKPAGYRVSCAPLVTDLPIVLVSVFLLAQFSRSHGILGILSLTGGLFVLYLAYENFTTKDIPINPSNMDSYGFSKGIITNFLNPHPYLFWITVGAPMIVKSMQFGLLSPILFIIGFYGMLVGSKLIIVLLVDRSKSYLNNRIYLFIVRLLGVGLLLFGIFFIKDGLTLMGSPFDKSPIH